MRLDKEEKAPSHNSSGGKFPVSQANYMGSKSHQIVNSSHAFLWYKMCSPSVLLSPTYE